MAKLSKEEIQDLARSIGIRTIVFKRMDADSDRMRQCPPLRIEETGFSR